jgi:predicted nucleic acid-binding protein
LLLYDSSSLISLARSGLLQLLSRVPVEAVILDVVAEESVDAGLAGGHADAAAIEEAIAGFPRRRGDRDVSADAAVLSTARGVGTLVANDLALGRRARNLGVRWLRTADLVVLAYRTSAIPADEGRAAIAALRDAGRLSPELASEYLQELG